LTDRNFPIVLNEFAKVGILDEVVAAGFKNSEGLCFRTPYCGTNKVLAKIPPGKSPNSSVDYGVQLSQAKLCAIIRKHALQSPNFSIRYNTRYVSHQEDGDLVHVQAESSTAGAVTLSAPFVVACDGANSAVRKFLQIPFEGFTWKDWQFVAVNIYYDFAKHGYPAANHVIDPEDWAVIVRASNEKEGLWRIAMGMPPDLKPSEVEPYVVAKVERLMPGPRPLDYEIEAISPYWAHEKAARSFRAGRVVLCGDAAHVS
jgi:2-polyprenyl-6-methoxyphenol hydroxylase-like FAD-dependent oxidoreductase